MLRNLSNLIRKTFDQFQTLPGRTKLPTSQSLRQFKSTASKPTPSLNIGYDSPCSPHEQQIPMPNPVNAVLAKDKQLATPYVDLRID